MSDTTRKTAPVIVPLIPAHPRLRFMTDAGAGAAAPDPAAQAAAAAAQATKDAVDQAAADAAKQPPWGDDPTKFDPDKAWTLIQNIKGDLEATKTKSAADLAEAVKTATAAGAKEALAGIGKLLSGEQEPETDPAKLQAQVADLGTQVAAKDTDLTKAQGDVKAGQIALAVALAAPALGASTKLLLANEQFKTSIASVEPTDEAAIAAAITKAVQETPALKATPPRSGSGEHVGATVQSLEAQLAVATKNRDFTETIRLKQAIAAAKA